jgi:hypothetical protein
MATKSVGRGGTAKRGPPPPAALLARRRQPGLSNTRYKHKKEK